MRFPRPILTVALLLVAGVASPRASAAQSIPSPYRFIETRHEAGAFGGWLDPDTGPFGFGPGAGPLVGLRYAIELSGPFSLEGVASTLLGERDVVDPRRSEGSRVIGQEDAFLTSVDARLKFALNGRRTWHGFGPYLMAGGGVVFDVAGEGALDLELEDTDRYTFDTSFLGLLGGGVRFFPVEGFMIRADVESRFWKIKTPSGFSDPDLNLGPVSRDQWVAGLGLTLGAAIRF
jgi:hypothetical protein